MKTIFEKQVKSQDQTKMDGFEDVSETRPSEIWKYFFFNNSNGTAKCKLCPNKVLSAPGGNAKGLKYHAKSEHNIVVANVDKQVFFKYFTR